MPADFPAREMSPLVQLFQRAHSKVTALQRMDDQIALLVEQHMRLQEEVRTIQRDINEEFERVVRYNQAPAKLLTEPAEQARVIDADAPDDEAAPVNGNGNGHPLAPAGTMEFPSERLS